MRIWDIHPKYLCRNHLLGEHRELHAIWQIITKDKKGYANHPETNRWKGKLKALYNRHEGLVKEMKKRKYNHQSDLDKKMAIGKKIQDFYIEDLKKQKTILKNKNCKCLL